MGFMGIHLEGNQTKFNVSRLAAFAGKIAFTYEDEPLGGNFEIRPRRHGVIRLD